MVILLNTIGGVALLGLGCLIAYVLYKISKHNKPKKPLSPWFNLDV